MELGRRWRIATSFGWVHLRLRAGAFIAGELALNDGEHARAELLFELERSREVQQALSEVSLLLRAGESFPAARFQDLPRPEAQLGELRRQLEMGLLSGLIELGFEPFAGTFHERDPLDIELPPLGSSSEAVDTSFIALRLLDAKGAPLPDRPFQIELPDGTVSRGSTDENGFGRVAGFRQDGDAKIVFPTFDELELKTKNVAERVTIPISDPPERDPFAGLDRSRSEESEGGEDDGSEPALERPGVEPPRFGTFELFLLDDVGVPLAGIDLLFTSAKGVEKVVTASSGSARLENALGPVRATLVDVGQVREVLRPRLQGPREPQAFDDQSAVVRPLSERVDAVELEPGTPVPVLLTPSIECHEIPGASFDFGRSYVRSSAVEQLADIAEALRDTSDVRAMIFGHTDLSGGEALNKELSERRAHAVHALLTHDSKAWEQLFSGSADGPHWQEKWDLEETQNMLNALGVTDDAGSPLTENGKRDAATKQAIRRFQRGDFPDRPAEQAPLVESDNLGVDGRRALFLAYAKRVTRQPIAPDRFAPIDGAPFMGCGEFNPLSLSAKDGASRRVNVFLFDPVTEPEDLPCRLRKLPPCRENVSPPLTAPPADGKPPFRCQVFRKLAEKCTSQPSPDLNHDLVLRFPLQLSGANQLAHVYKLEADDGTLTIERALADDARANDTGQVELAFEHLPELHRYRLTCDDGEQAPYTVFDFATLKELREHFDDGQLALDLSLPAAFLAHAAQASDAADDDASANDDGTSVDDSAAEERPDTA